MTEGRLIKSVRETDIIAERVEEGIQKNAGVRNCDSTKKTLKERAEEKTYINAG